jgi:hypothetical protein
MKRYLLATFVIAVLAFTCVAQVENDVVGTWKMDASRSKFVSSSDAPALVVIKYERAGDLLHETMNVTNAGGLMTRTMNYALDGSELTNGAGEDRVVSKIVSKDGVINLVWTDDGGVFTRSVTLSPDRRIMTISAHDSNPEVKADDVIVFQRQ